MSDTSLNPQKKPRVEAFVISLARATERHSQVRKLQEDCPLPCHVVDAVDGARLDADEIKRIYKPKLYRPRYPFPLQVGEIGAFLSHRKAWAEIVERNLDAGLIVEDDIELDLPGFDRALQVAIDNVRPMDYIQFRVSWEDRRPTESPVMNRTNVVPLGATSQLVGRAAAERLLELSETFDRPIDVFVQMKWLTGIGTHLVSPSYVTEISRRLGGTTVRKKSRAFWGRMHRNLLRPIYRAKLRAFTYWFGSGNGTAGGKPHRSTYNRAA